MMNTLYNTLIVLGLLTLVGVVFIVFLSILKIIIGIFLGEY